MHVWPEQPTTVAASEAVADGTTLAIDVDTIQRRWRLVLVSVNEHPVEPSTRFKILNEALLPFTLTFRSEVHLPDGNPLLAACESVEAVNAMPES